MTLVPINAAQAKDLAGYESDPGRAAREWQTYQGERWANRNPMDALATDESFRYRYGITKTWAARDALRELPRDLSFIEVGCSRGAHLNLLRSLGFSKLYGMDISLPALQQVGESNVCQGDAAHLPFADGAADVVTTAGSMMHFGPADRMQASIRELARVTRRYLFVAELWSNQQMIVSFGELLPPVWLFQWELAVPNLLGPEWKVRYHKIYSLVKHEGLYAPLCFTLFERAA